eukprot:1183565-Rhodomonas_salina.2
MPGSGTRVRGTRVRGTRYPGIDVCTSSSSSSHNEYFLLRGSILQLLASIQDQHTKTGKMRTGPGRILLAQNVLGLVVPQKLATAGVFV